MLTRFKDLGRLTWPCSRSFTDVDVLALLDGIHSQQLPIWANKETTMTTPLNVFISYSHAERDYFPIFKNDFSQYVKLPNLDINVFSDDELPLGSDWDKYLQNKVADCDVMLLLVSQTFMNSKYIQEKEFGAAIERLKKGNNLLIVPIYFAPCLFANNEELARLQFFKPHGDNFDKAKKGNDFSYIDLVTFRETDGQPIPNANRPHYMMALMQKLAPQFKKIKSR
jgi:hypothetical protein